MTDIILASYNGEDYIGQLLDSIKAQTYTDWRLIISDDGSTDGTESVIRKFMEEMPEEKVVFRQNDPGTGSARDNFMRTLTESTAEYTMFCDQDDVWLPSKIEDTLGAMKKAEGEIRERYGLEEDEMPLPVLVHTDAFVADEDLNVISDSFMIYMGFKGRMTPESRLIQNDCAGACCMMNRTLTDMMQLAAGGSRHMTMHDHFAALIASNFGCVVYLDRPLMLYRQHGDNSVGAVRKTAAGAASDMREAKTDFREMMLKYCEQARYFVYLYEPYITDVRKLRMLMGFGRLFKMNKASRVKFCLRYGIMKTGMTKRIGQILWI